MKKTLVIVAILLLAGSGALAWHRYGPCASMIEKRVASVGVSRLEAEFDAWWASRERRDSTVILKELPSGMQALRPQRAFLRGEGLFLQIKERFNETDGVFVAATRVDDEGKLSSDAVLQFHRLGSRVFRYHKCE